MLFGMLGTFEAGTTAVDVIEAMVLTAFLGGTFAPGAVALARRAELQAPEDRTLLN